MSSHAKEKIYLGSPLFHLHIQVKFLIMKERFLNRLAVLSQLNSSCGFGYEIVKNITWLIVMACPVGLGFGFQLQRKYLGFYYHQYHG